MSREKPRNLAASVRQRLFNLAQERREDFGLVLTRYGLERFLYRLAQSQYRDQFILKGALLFEFGRIVLIAQLAILTSKGRVKIALRESDGYLLKS